MQGLKHLISCRCILPQFKTLKNPPVHQFVAFSIIDDDGNVQPKFMQCPNCGIVHKVVEISKSEIQQGREHMSSLVSIDELKLSLDDRLVAVLESNDVDVATWEEVEFIVSNEDQWGRHVVLNTDIEGDETHVKYLRILTATMFKISQASRKEYANRQGL